MSKIKKIKEEREFPKTHLIHLISAITIGALAALDGLVFFFTIKITGISPPWWVGIGVGIFLMALAVPFMIKADKALFGKGGDAPDHLITTGVFFQVRNPMYFAIILFYLAIVAFFMSLIAFIAWIVILIIYNRLVDYEEKILAEIFPEEYEAYKKRTSKWIPR